MKNFHVSTTDNNSEVTTGTLSAQEMNAANPAIYHFIETQDTDFCQFKTENGFVIVRRENKNELY